MFRKIASRIAGAIAGAVVAWILQALTELGVEPVAGFGDSLEGTITLALVTVFVVVYGIVHKAIDARINPADDA